MNKRIMFTLFALLLAPLAAQAADIGQYNLVWDSPSKDSLDSMPLSGRLGAGANVWVEDGAIWIYPSHNGAYDERGRLLKLGCIRITPLNGKLGDAGFRQELVLADGTIVIAQGDFKASLWFAGETLILEACSGKPLVYDVAFGTWRDKKREGILIDVFEETKSSFPADQVMAGTTGFVWFHRNADFPVNLVQKAKGQGIPAEALHDVTTKRIFGGAAVIEGGLSEPVGSAVQWQFWDGKAWTGRTAARKNMVMALRLGGRVDADPKQWSAEATALLDPDARKAAKADEAKRWDDFWSRSHVFIAQKPTTNNQQPDAFLVGRNYQLFRYMLACNRGGELPLLFNGGIFTMDNKPGRITGNSPQPLSAGDPSTPDYRRWMFCRFMSQNQRWLGWPTLAGGDADLLEPSMAFYRDRAAVAAARAKRNGAEGMVYPEPLDVWGLCSVAPTGNGLCGMGHLHYHFSMMLEHAWMALQAHDALGISIGKDLPWIEGTVLFYNSFYRAETKKRTGKELTPDGKLRIYPSNGLEFAIGATDPIEVVCALRRITEGLLALPDLPAASRERLHRIQPTLPGLPIGKRKGRESLFPARSLEQEANPWEPIEMFAAWPYRMVGVTKPETLQLARDMWETIPEARAKFCKQDFSWMATLANVASLARPEEAKKRAVHKMANTVVPQARFPAFFGPGHDWLPDHNWGGSGMVGMQEMLLAPEPGPAGKLHLFPAWPADWDVDFKLHAPGPTIVEGVLKGGKLESLKVTPASRAKDIVNWLGKQPPYEPPAADAKGDQPPAYLKQDKPAEGAEAAVPASKALPCETKEQRDVRMAWWREARFGMFIHWGVFSVPAGVYKGQTFPGPSEYLMMNAKIPAAEYREFARGFTASNYNADAIVRLARQAGMKYIVITAKHHDGFAMFPSGASDWNITQTPCGKDILKPLAEACRKHGVKLGFYYSQAVDWVNGGAGTLASDGTNPDIDKYINEVAVPQVRELLTNYGEFPSVIWWDTPSAMNEERAAKLLALLKLKPGVIHNNRLLKMAGHMGVIDMQNLEANKRDPFFGDTETPEQHIPATGLSDRDFEVCMTMNDIWGYKRDDHNWKSTRVLLRHLIDIASKGGNYLLNIGPMADGTIPAPSVERLENIGKWMAVNNEAIYGTHASPFTNLTWGRCTQKKHEGGTTLYLHVFDWPAPSQIEGSKNVRLLVPGLKNEVKSARLLADGTELEFKTGARGVFIYLPAEAPDTNASVIRMEIVGEPKVVPMAPPLSQGKPVSASSQFNQSGYEAAKAVDGDSKTRWASDFAARSGWLEIDLGDAKEIRRVWLSEVEYPETREFAIEVKQGDAWKEVARGTTIGVDREITFPPVKARLVRLNVLKAESPININEFQVFAQ